MLRGMMSTAPVSEADVQWMRQHEVWSCEDKHFTQSSATNMLQTAQEALADAPACNGPCRSVHQEVSLSRKVTLRCDDGVSLGIQVGIDPKTGQLYVQGVLLYAETAVGCFNRMLSAHEQHRVIRPGDLIVQVNDVTHAEEMKRIIEASPGLVSIYFGSESHDEEDVATTQGETCQYLQILQ